MPLRPLVLITPSAAAAVELPRRLASAAGARAAIYAFKPRELARTLAEPALLGAGLRAWDSGHDALVAAHLLDGPHGLRLDAALPRPPVARALARTLTELRRAGLAPDPLDALARGGVAPASPAVAFTPPTPEDGDRLRALAGLYRRFHETCQGRVADPAALFRAAAEHVTEARWLSGADVLIVDELETDPLEREFLKALASVWPVKLLSAGRPRGLRAGSFLAWAEAQGIHGVAWGATPLAPLQPPAPPAGLRRLREALFEPPAGEPARDGSVELVTAGGEAAEVRAVVRRLLRAAAAGVAFEDMGVVLPRPDDYAPLFSDALQRLGIPFRLHPSLPLRFGRCARSLLLLFRCRGLARAAVMEFLTFAPIPFGEFLGEGTVAKPSRWDEISRDARIVSGLDRWMVGLRHFALQESEGAGREKEERYRERRLQTVADAEALLRVVELLSSELDGLAGEAPWPEWSERLAGVLDHWIGHDRDREAVSEVVADLAGLGAAAGRARWEEVEGVVEARFEWERLPLDPVPQGAVHVGALDAMAGLPFRVLAIVGLVEGGHPGVLRPDPFLLDGERTALSALVRAQAPPAAPGSAASDEPAEAPAPRVAGEQATSTRGPARATRPARHAQAERTGGQLSLFAAIDEPVAAATGTRVPDPPPALLPTTQDRVLEARRLFHRAVRQATERLVLSYPRADPRSGRERMPSLFFVAAASALEGQPLTGARLDALVVEDTLDALAPDDALDRGERDRVRVRAGGREAAEAIAAGSPFFKQSKLASEQRWSNELTAYDGLVQPLPPELAARLDPASAPRPLSASQLATWSRCGFQYLLRYVLNLEAALEPEERKRLEPLERGTLFHEVAERFLRERRRRGELPVRDTPETRARVGELADEALQALVEGSPPRFVLLWERERARFHETVRAWLAREAMLAERSRPAHFEVVFGSTRELAEDEPHSPEPLEIELSDGRRLRVTGRIDRIDRRDDGLVLRDYKTGRAPRDDGRIFRGGQQLQIPFYVLAAQRLFPGEKVVEAFLDYVDGGRQVAFDPALAGSDAFKDLLRGLGDAIAQGLFVQEPAACDWCDYTAVCGPKPLLQLRRTYKIRDPKLQRVLHLRSVG